jgi:hypothetical protein
VRVTSSR